MSEIVWKWIVVAILFVATLLVGGLTGFNQQPLAMRAGAIILLMALGMAIGWRVR